MLAGRTAIDTQNNSLNIDLMEEEDMDCWTDTAMKLKQVLY